MPEDRNTFENIVADLGHAIADIAAEIGNPAQEPQKTIYFLRKLGWNIPVDIDLSGKNLSFINNLSGLSMDSPADFVELITALVGVVGDFDKIKDELVLGPQFNEFTTEFPRQLLDYAVLTFLESQYPKIFSVFLFLGIAETSYQTPASTARIPFKQYRIEWDRLLTFLQNPQEIPEKVYGWGTSGFNGKLLIEHIEYLLTSFNVQVGRYSPTSEIGNKFNLDGDGLYAPFFDTEDIKAGIEIYPVKTDSTADNAGFAVSPFVFGSSEKEVQINDFLKLIIEALIKLDKTTGIEIRPKTNISLFDLTSDSTTAGEIKLTLRIGDEDGLLTIGDKGSSRLEIGAIDLAGFAKISNQSQEFGIETGLKNSKVVLDFSSGDGFISQVLPLEPVETPLDITVGYSNIKGVYFKGSAGIEIKLPVHLELGPIEISGITLAFKFEDRKIPINIGADFNAKLGPLSLSIENIGVSLNLNFPEDNRGNLGPFDLAFGFKPPNGVGISVDAGVVMGGGYLFFDFENGEYAGVLELTFSDFLSLKAIGLITTKMPDGSKGFSLVVIITAEFTIQLGYGFVFLGAGGLLGLNRTMKLEPLAEGVRTGATANIMFPVNIVENAPKIISDLKVFFPIQLGIFLIGPMAKLGWGTPTLINISLGIIIEIRTTEGGGIDRIAILGVLKCILPDENAALLVLQVNFIGAIDFQKKYAFFFASIFDSRVLFITIEGEMGVLVAWGDDANFVVSVGGFHPRFNPPPLPFPVPKRVSLNILNESWGKIRVEGYFAVTTNTAQFGSKIEVYFGFSEFKIEGHLAFDALFQFNPFYFIIEISGKVSLKVFGLDLFSISLEFSLEGTSPWRAKGYGKIKILFITFKARFDETWGQAENTQLPPIEIIPILRSELEKTQNWLAITPAANHLLVSLRTLPEANGEDPESLVLHPVGSLQISQRAVPLNITLDKFGNQKPVDAKKLNFIPAGSFISIADHKESFARAQFQDMDDSKKLSSPAYEKETGGYDLSVDGKQTDFGKITVRHVRYELITIDSAYKRFRNRFFSVLQVMFVGFLANSAVSKTKMSFKHKKQHLPFADKINVAPGNFTVTRTKDNTPYDAGSMNFSSHASAEEYMNKILSGESLSADELQVLPMNEVNI